MTIDRRTSGWLYPTSPCQTPTLAAATRHPDAGSTGPHSWRHGWRSLLGFLLMSGTQAVVLASERDPVDVGARDSLASEWVDDSELGGWITRFAEDRKSLELKYQEPLSPVRAERMREFHRSYLLDLDRIDPATLSRAGLVDHALMRNELEYRLALAELDQQRDAEVLALVPAVVPLVELLEKHERTHRLDAKGTAESFVAAERALQATRQRWERSGLAVTDADSPPPVDAATALRAATAVNRLSTRLADMHRFYEGYDPLYSWWCRQPYETLATAVRDLAASLSRLGGDDGDPDRILGIPVGPRAMEIELAHEAIPYSPAELIEIAEREFRWCDEQMLAASRELGFGEDWRAALESVKERHVPPGEQPAMIARLAEEAIRFVKDRHLVTVPPLCEDVWRMEMMTPERQRVNPFFLGGDTIIVSYPTDTMTHEEKRMSMRGNNEHFARATVHHELIPGHHLQLFMINRHRPHRREFRTPFWIEGWALYWEMRLWDEGFARSAEDRVGMLFWRMHRCARIVFSLGFQLGRMTPEQCVDYLVERVGHERANAEAEVRRSLVGGYPPLYQAAYMLGGLQLRALRAECVDSGAMAEVDFHDAILRQGPIPIALVRLALANETLDPEAALAWRFADDPKGASQ